jgi:hypothetical protein
VLRYALGAMVAGTALAVVAAAPALADNTNLTAHPAPDTTSTTGVCDNAACLVGATDKSRGDTDTAAPVTSAGQPLYTCAYSPAPPDLLPSPDPHQGEPGKWVMRKCTLRAATAENNALMPVVGMIVWQPLAQPSAAALALTAYRQLKPPAPAIAVSPPPTSPEIVGMPLWLAIAPSLWNPIRQTASAGAAAVTAIATPVAVTWDMGDGHSVVCHGPGTPYPVNATSRTPASSPTCGYTFADPSSAAPAGKFAVTATVQWHVEWTGTGGLRGAFADLRSSANTQVKVIEVQALVSEVNR